MANINNFNNEAGAVFKDESVTLNVQQNFGNVAEKKTDAPSVDTSKREALIKRGKISKIDLFRVAIALH